MQLPRPGFPVRCGLSVDFVDSLIYRVSEVFLREVFERI